MIGPAAVSVLQDGARIAVVNDDVEEAISCHWAPRPKHPLAHYMKGNSRRVV